MDRERQFDYHACLPYPTETHAEALEELLEIIYELEKLHHQQKFQEFSFGTGYAPDVCVFTNKLQSWMKRKLTIPLNLKLKLTNILLKEAFDAVEPTFFVRYGSLVLNIWSNSVGQREIKQYFGKSSQDLNFSFTDLGKVVRNYVVLGEIRQNASELSVRHPNLLSGLGGSAGASKRQKKQMTQIEVALMLAKQFAPCFEFSDEVADFLNREILVFLGSQHHFPPQSQVLAAFGALIPFASFNSHKVFMPLVMNLWRKVPLDVANMFLMPLIAEFQVYSLIFGFNSMLTNEMLSCCFQSHLHSMQIPLISSQKASTNNKKKKVSLAGKTNTSNSDVYSFARLVVYSLELGSLDLLLSFQNAVLSFCHPSNVGIWTSLILSTFSEITICYTRRLNLEQQGEILVKQGKLTKEHTDRIVQIVKQPVMMSIFSTLGLIFTQAVNILRLMAFLSPNMICDEVLMLVYPTLQHSLHQPQRLIASIACLEQLAKPLTTINRYKMHLTTLLELAVPNLDANDPKKCFLTISLFQTVAGLCKFEDLSNGQTESAASRILPLVVRSLEEGQIVEVSAEESLQVVLGSSAAFGELLTVFMKRVFLLLKTTSEAKLSSAASSCVLRVLLSCSKEIFNKLLGITINEIHNPEQQNYDAFAQVCGAFVRANSFLVFPKLFKLLLLSIRMEIFENHAGKTRVATPRDSSLIRYLSVLNMCLISANPQLLLNAQSELSALFIELRENTGSSVVYTLANTIHHAIVALTGYSVILPAPNNTYPNAELGLNVIEANGIRWNVPTKDSCLFAINLFNDHFVYSQKTILESISNASNNVADSDKVSDGLIFIRTTTGAIAPLCEDTQVIKIKQQIANLLLEIYPKISKDDVSSLKEVLFVAKVWMCDFMYERTARLDTHQVNLYIYEKRLYDLPGNHKRGLPPAVLARRAQVYHNQRLQIKTQYRNQVSLVEEELIFKILIDACFSVYPAVTRNALSALYSPMKLFNNNSLYLRVYDDVLTRIENHLKNNEFEKAEGGFGLLKYRSFGLKTVGRSSERLLQFVKLCILGVGADNRQLVNAATQVFFYLLPDVLRVGITDTDHSWRDIESLIAFLIDKPLDSQHWRDALLRTSTMLMISICPQLPLNSKMLKILLEGLVVQHPDVRLTAVLACLNMLQSVFWTGMVGFDINNFKASGQIEVPFDVKQTTNKDYFENDLSSFIKRSPLPVVKSLKSQPRPTANLLKFASQAVEPKAGFWRIITETNSKTNRLPMLTQKDKQSIDDAFKGTTDTEFYTNLIKMRQLEPRAEDDRLNKSAALLFRNLMALSCLGFNTNAEFVIDEILRHAHLNDKNWHRVTAEALCGLIMALPLDVDNKLVELVNKLLCEDVINSLSSENIVYYTAALGFAIPNIDFRRIDKLISIIEQISHPSTSPTGGGFKLSLRTSLHTELMDAIGTRRNSLKSISDRWPLWNHSLQTTRETAVEEVSVAISTTLNWQPVVLHSGNCKCDLVGKVISLETGDYLKSLFRHQSDKSEISLLGLILNLLHVIGGYAWVDILVSEAFPLLLKLSAVRDDPEVLELVTQVFSELSITEFGMDSLNKIVDMVSHSIKSEQWHQRIRMLLFTQSFFFNHLMLMSSSQRVMLANLTCDLLNDNQAEVRELAADTLSGIVRCSPVKEQEEYVTKLTSDFMKRIGKNTSLVSRHAAVLGLGGIIGAFPYTSPPPKWVPVVLAAIASKAAGDSGIVGKSAKQVLSDFKKTRQDTWHIDQLAFSQDQLDDLDGVLWRNYFA